MGYFKTSIFVASQMTAECSAVSKVEKANHPLLQVTFPENVVYFMNAAGLLKLRVDFAVYLIWIHNLNVHVVSVLGTEAFNSKSLDVAVTF